jgi:hypothetical protein
MDFNWDVANCESEKKIQSFFQSIFNYNDPNVVEKVVGNGDGGVISKSISELVRRKELKEKIRQAKTQAQQLFQL